jgi:hypothetical protein
MSQVTAETLLNQIASLPISEKVKLHALLDEHLKNPDVTASGVKLAKPIPTPDPAPSMRWMNEHFHEYGGQWVAIDGDRLIAHGANADEVFAAAELTPLRETLSIGAIASCVILKALTRVLSRARSSQRASL